MSKRVKINGKKVAFKQAIFQIDEAHLQYEKFNGQMSEEIVRLNLNRGDSVAAIVHRTADDSLILAEQFRFSTYEKGPGWILEIPAGIIEDKDSNAEDTMRREIVEEVGYRVNKLQHIHTFYLSPGGTSERIFLFYAAVSAKDKVSDGGGLPDEAEDIRTEIILVDDLLAKLKAGEIIDAKTIIGLQWLQINRDNL